MESIRMTPVPAADGLVFMEPVTKWEREFIVGYRCLSADDQERLLLVLNALVSVKPMTESEVHVR
jgi:hypothetical protein